MKGIKYVNLIETGPGVIEIREVESVKLAVPVNNTLVYQTAFLATDTPSCVLIVRALQLHSYLAIQLASYYIAIAIYHIRISIASYT